jgi:NADH-quinone oxidoreductase subunit F
MSAAPEIVFAGTNGGAVTDLAEYESTGGFTWIAKARAMTPDAVIEELNTSGLKGRGGAFFPTGRKWSFVPKPEQNPRPHYLVVNADESEPGTFKDREIMLRVPFRFLEGCLIGAHAIQAKHVFVYIRGEYEREYETLASALEQMKKKKGLLGDVTVVLHRGAGAYICGEETALLESLEGQRGQPRTKPPFPAVAGLYASPTAVNNVESIVAATSVLELGGATYATYGVEDSTGTRVFSLSGNVVRGGNYELPHGFPLKELIYEVGGGIADGRTLKAVIPGGSSTVILTAAEVEQANLDFTSLAALGTAIGSAAVIALDDRCCMVQLAVRVSQFYEHESCGKCTPCRVGTRWLTQILQKIEEGRGEPGDLDMLLDVGDRINGKCLCPLGDSDAIAVASYVAKFREEFVAHITEGGCPMRGGSSLDGVLAPVAVHAKHIAQHGLAAHRISTPLPVVST